MIQLDESWKLDVLFMMKSRMLAVLFWLSLLSWDLARCSHNRRPSYPSRTSYPQQQQQNNYPPIRDSPSIQSSPGLYPNSDNYDYGDSVRENNGPSKLEQGASGSCFMAQTYLQSIPSGDVKTLPGLEWLDVEDRVVSRDTCGQACCELGQIRCQYMWMVKGKCLAVSCAGADSNLCSPADFSASSGNVESTYFRMGFSKDAAVATDDAGLTDGRLVTATTTTTEPVPAPLATTPEQTTGPVEVTVSEATTKGEDDTKLQHTTSVASANSQTPPITEPESITVAVEGTKDLTLPTDSTQLFSNTWPERDSLVYNWELLKGPHGGTLNGRDQKVIRLSNLGEGVYQLKLTVYDQYTPEESGEAYVNVTVHPANRVNTPPVPVIRPSQDVTIHLPQNLILDASGSQDDQDSSELTYHWEEVAGPVGDSAHMVDDPVIDIEDLQPGHYRFRLTVTDREGARAEAFVNVTVEPEQDYPPTANAGLNQLIRLPKTEVYIDGTKSTDDKGIASYEWVMSSGPGSVDLEGSSTSILHVRNLDLGTYAFTLTVTDTAGQQSSDEVTVTVLPEKNVPPVAIAGGNRTVLHPHTSVKLNGSNSTDDYRIDSYHWSQISGPTDVRLSGVNSNMLTVEGLHIDESVGSPTLYEFMLTVVDYANLTDNDTVFVIYRKDPQTPPIASAGPPVTITLPQDTVSLDGSKSADDFGIESYQWVRSSNSPAAGSVVDGSDKKPVLVLSGLVSGTYNFTLTVTNKYGKSAVDTVSLTVLPNPLDPYIIQAQLEGNISNFTQANKTHLRRTLQLLLKDLEADYDVIIERCLPFGTHILVEFYAVGRDSHAKLNSSLAYKILTANGQDFQFSKFHFLKVDMKVCHLPCSGHGVCDQVTRRCKCSTFWMENPFKARFGKMESNCEWSVFYVALVGLAAAVVVFIAFWLCCCCCLRKRRISRSKRRIRYAILDHTDAEEGVKMLPREVHQTTSLMVSESDTEEEILFETKKNQNSTSLKNGRVGGGERMGNGTRKTVSSSPKPDT